MKSAKFPKQINHKSQTFIHESRSLLGHFFGFSSELPPNQDRMKRPSIKRSLKTSFCGLLGISDLKIQVRDQIL